MEDEGTENESKSWFHRVFLAGLGGVALTADALGHLTNCLAESGREAGARIKKTGASVQPAKPGRRQSKAAGFEANVKSALDSRTLPTSEQISQISLQIDKIEAQLTELEKTALPE
jgi:hypothetical protein